MTTTATDPAPATMSAADDQPRPLHVRTVDDNLSVLGAALGAAGMIWVVVGQMIPADSWFSFVVCWYAAFIGLYAAVSSLGNSRLVVADRVAAAVMYGGAIIALGGLVAAIVFTLVRGLHALPHWNFYTDDMAGVRPLDGPSRGGIVHALIGSMIEVAIAVAITLPLGIGTAVYMTEIGGRFSRVVRTVVEAMTALPSIVAGLFIYTVLIVTVHFPRSGFAGAMAISVMMLPIIARAADVVLRIVPGGLREAGLALGSTQWRTVWHVVLPTARPGLATALILGIARGVGETSPVLLTSGQSTFINGDPFHSTMNSLPLFIYFAVRSGQPSYIVRGYGAGCVLIAVVLILFVTARRLARQKGAR
jgi:phosphate transport system permease protein